MPAWGSSWGGAWGAAWDQQPSNPAGWGAAWGTSWAASWRGPTAEALPDVVTGTDWSRPHLHETYRISIRLQPRFRVTVSRGRQALARVALRAGAAVLISRGRVSAFAVTAQPRALGATFAGRSAVASVRVRSSVDASCSRGRMERAAARVSPRGNVTVGRGFAAVVTVRAHADARSRYIDAAKVRAADADDVAILLRRTKGKVNG
jgi:hypothetical protein